MTSFLEFHLISFYLVDTERIELSFFRCKRKIIPLYDAPKLVVGCSLYIAKYDMMMKSWSPKVTNNNWWPKLRPNGTHVLYGDWQATYLAEMATGVEIRILSPNGARVYSLGWLDIDTFLIITENPDAVYQVRLADVQSVNGVFTIPASAKLADTTAANWGNARGGSWAIGQSNGQPRTTKNGAPFRSDIIDQYGVSVAGDHLVTMLKDVELLHFNGTTLIRTLPMDSAYTVNEQGDILAGYYGTIRCHPFDAPSLDATITPWKREGSAGAVPIRVNGDLWIWTFTALNEDQPNEEGLALGRRPGEKDPIVVHNFSGVASDVIVVGNEFVIAANDVKGRMEVRWVPIDTPREKLQAPSSPSASPSPAPPTNIPKLPRPIWTGYYFSMSDRYGDNPSAPGSVQLVIEPAAVSRAVALGMKVIVPLECVSLVPLNQLVAVTADGATIQEVETNIAAARVKLAELNISRPISSYLDNDDWPRLPNPQPDWYAPQAYCKKDETFTAFQARIQSVMAKFPSNKPVLLVCQAYNTNLLHTDNLLPLQYVYPEIARQDSRVIGIIWFSDGRTDATTGRGGTRANPTIRVAHSATQAASPGVPVLQTIVGPSPSRSASASPSGSPSPAPTRASESASPSASESASPSASPSFAPPELPRPVSVWIRLRRWFRRWF